MCQEQAGDNQPGDAQQHVVPERPTQELHHAQQKRHNRKGSDLKCRPPDPARPVRLAPQDTPHQDRQPRRQGRRFVTTNLRVQTPQQRPLATVTGRPIQPATQRNPAAALPQNADQQDSHGHARQNRQQTPGMPPLACQPRPTDQQRQRSQSNEPGLLFQVHCQPQRCAEREGSPQPATPAQRLTTPQPQPGQGTRRGQRFAHSSKSLEAGNQHEVPQAGKRGQASAACALRHNGRHQQAIGHQHRQVAELQSTERVAARPHHRAPKRIHTGKVEVVVLGDLTGDLQHVAGNTHVVEKIDAPNARVHRLQVPDQRNQRHHPTDRQNECAPSGQSGAAGRRWPLGHRRAPRETPRQFPRPATLPGSIGWGEGKRPQRDGQQDERRPEQPHPTRWNGRVAVGRSAVLARDAQRMGQGDPEHDQQPRASRSA